MDASNLRQLESGLELDRRGRLTYEGYLHLDKVLGAQEPLSRPEHHDEMLFIVQHQTAELWFKLLIHELTSGIDHLSRDQLGPCKKILRRVSAIQRQLFEQWAVLETLTPAEYAEFRGVLGSASGFQSLQYRRVEFLLGNKNRGMLRVFRHDPEQHEALKVTLESPSLYDEFLRYLHRHGHPLPPASVERDWSEPHEFDQTVVAVLRHIYENRGLFFDVYEICERLVDVEDSFQLWRFRHLRTVARIIGYKRGTGGSSGVPFLEKALNLQFFPELYAVRSEIGAG